MNHPLAPLLQAFYTQPLAPDDRSRIHNTLLASLTDPAHHKAAIACITHVANSPNPGPIDPYLLHHSLHTIETIARTSFSTIPSSDLSALQNLLLDFLTNANLRHLNQETPQTDCVPPHALNKAAAALVALSKRQWLADPNATDAFFPQILFRLVDSPGHSPRSLASMLSGHALLTTLLDDALSARRDLRAEDSAKLKHIIASHGPRLLTALEVAQRAAGPNVPQHVAPAAARAVASLCRLSPTVSSDACAILAHSIHGRFDPVSPHILSAATDILSLRVNVAPEPIAGAVIVSLEALAAGSRTRKEEARVAPALLSLVDALVDRLIDNRNLSSRVLNSSKEIAYEKEEGDVKQNKKQMLERILNALMGVAVRWAKDRPSWFPRVLESWTNVFDVSFDFNQQEDVLLVERVYPSVSALCSRQLFFATNRAVLEKLRQPGPSFFGQAPEIAGSDKLQDLSQWDKQVEIMTDIVLSPYGGSYSALFSDSSGTDIKHGNDDLNDDDDDDDDDDFNAGDSNGSINLNGKTTGGNDENDPPGGDPAGWGCSISVIKYTACCIDTLTAIAHYCPSEARKAAEVTFKALSHASDSSPAALVDVYNALLLANNLGCLIPDSDSISLMQPICSLAAHGVWKVGRIGVMALRALSIHSVTLTKSTGSRRGPALNTALGIVKVARQALVASPPGRITAIAAFLTVCIYDRARELFKDTPPFGIDEIIPISIGALTHEQERIGYALLATSSLINWIIVPPKNDKGLRIRWSDEEWTNRQKKLAEISATLFSPLAQLSDSNAPLLAPDEIALRMVTRQAALLKTVTCSFSGVYGRGVDVIWNVCVREGVRRLISILHSISQQVTSLDAVTVEKLRHNLTATVSGILGAIVSAAYICNRCASVEKYSPGREAVQAVLGLANHPALCSVANQIMRLMRDRIAAGEAEMLETGVDLAAKCLQNLTSNPEAISSDNNWKRMEDDVSEISVSLLTESLKRHWRVMWPADTVPTDTEQPVQGSEAGKAVFFKALSGLIEALKSHQLETCRAALLALPQLDASRRLFSRGEAFQKTGAGVTIAVECLQILGAGGDSGRESLSDDAVDVLWGVVNADHATFTHNLPDIVRQVGGGSIDEVGLQQVVALFGGAEDRSSFSRIALAAANDMVFYSTLRPSL